MEDAAQLQPLLHTLVLFSYIVHSNKTNDLQWGLVEHHCDSTKNGYLYKQKRTHANSPILHLAGIFSVTINPMRSCVEFDSMVVTYLSVQVIFPFTPFCMSQVLFVKPIGDLNALKLPP